MKGGMLFPIVREYTPMTGKEFSQALRGGRNVYGTLIVSPSPHWLAAMRRVGPDFVFIDTEHIALDRSVVS